MATAAVIGAGSVGSMVMRELSRRGWDVVGYERATIASDDTAAGGPSRLFRFLYGEGSDYVPLLLRSRLLWSQLEAVARTQLFFGGGAITVGPLDSPWMQEMRRCAEQFELPHELLDEHDMADRYPQVVVAEGEFGMLDSGGGIVLTKQAISAAVIDAVRHGAELREHECVLGLEEVAGGVAVRTEAGATRFDVAVVAAGASAASLVEHTIVPYGLTGTMHVPEGPGFDPFAFPPVMWLDAAGQSTQGSQPLPGGQLVKFFAGAPEPLKGLDVGGSGASAAALAQAEAILPTKLRGVRAAPVEGMTYYDGLTEDGHPLVGRSTSSERIVLCTGFSLHGFKLATGVAELVAKTVADDEDFTEYRFLRPDRFSSGGEDSVASVWWSDRKSRA